MDKFSNEMNERTLEKTFIAMVKMISPYLRENWDALWTGYDLVVLSGEECHTIVMEKTITDDPIFTTGSDANIPHVGNADKRIGFWISEDENGVPLMRFTNVFDERSYRRDQFDEFVAGFGAMLIAAS